jgi:hypothetical protein
MADLLIPGDNRGVAGVRTGLASPGYLRWFHFPVLPNVAPNCAPGGVKVVRVACRGLS